MKTLAHLEAELQRIEALLALLKPLGAVNFTRIISWNPNGGADVTTWAELIALLKIAPSPMQIYIEADAVVPPGVWEMQDSTFFGKLSGAITLTVSDGAALRNLRGIQDNLTLKSVSSAPILQFDFPAGQPAVFTMLFGARLQTSGTAQIVRVPAGNVFILAMFVAGGLVNPTPGLGTFFIEAGATGILLSEGANNPLTAFGDIAQDGPGAVLIYAGFAGPYPTPAGFTGTVVNIAVDLNGGSGPTAFRPASGIGGPLSLGTNYFDTSLGPAGKPIWWTGAIWVDATGAPA